MMGYTTQLLELGGIHLLNLKNRQLLFSVFAILTSCYGYCQKNRGTITLTDGKEISGWVKATPKVLKFKATEDGKTVTYNHVNAVAAVLLLEGNKIAMYEYVSLADAKKPLLLRVFINGYLKLYLKQSSNYTYFGPGVGSAMKGSSTFYIKRKPEKHGQFFTAYGYIPKITFKKMAASYFGDCPALQQKVENGEFKKNDFEEVVHFYNHNCAPEKE